MTATAAGMRVLTVSTLYPNAASPLHGIFVENRLRQLVASGGVCPRVVAPVPWFPSTAAVFGRYADFARAPRRGERFGIAIEHPRYPVLPKLGMSAAPLALYATLRREAARLRREGWDFDVIDAHYFYPDGVAAVALGRSLGRPVIVTARGSDLTLLPRHPLPRAMIRWAARNADGLVTVSGGLRDDLVGLGADPARVRVLRNGVDLALFRPVERAAARAQLGVSGPVLLSVGHLIPRKGHDIAIAALPDLPDAALLIAGAGPEREALLALAARLGVGGRVRFLGPVPHADLPPIYGAADALVLASSREGWANVLLEAMACGTPAIASDIPGTREIVTAPASGLLMPSRDPEGLVAAARRLLASPPARTATRAYAEGFGWDATTRGQKALFAEVLAARQS